MFVGVLQRLVRDTSLRSLKLNLSNSLANPLAVPSTNRPAYQLAATMALGPLLGCAVLLGTMLQSGSVQAADLTWSGEYRVEAVSIQNADLAGNHDTSYLLHHLVLTPKIVAGDGLAIYTRFDILNNSVFGRNNQAGQTFGAGPNPNPNPPAGSAPGTPATTDPENPSNAWSNTQGAGSLHVTSLYAVWSQEFGQLIVGRTPMQFGLGVAYNAGNGLFDKYIDTRDMIGYKVVMGNLFFLPMIGKMSEGDLGNNDDVDDYMMQVQYENPETESAAGVLYRIRTALGHGNDSPVSKDNNTIGGPKASVQTSMKLTQWTLYGAQRFADFHLGLEANLLTGQTGVVTESGSQVSMNAFAIAAELRWKPRDSRLTGLLKMGLASGDDPGTQDKYEGFIFNRNYDVGVLMFNHALGNNNLNALRTGVIRNTALTAANHIDDEAISNAFYFAPSVDFAWRENMSFGGGFVYGILDAPPVSGGSKNLGGEVDLNFTYKPYERVTWVTELGVLMPGAAWKGGPSNYGNGLAFGGVTKAAISF